MCHCLNGSRHTYLRSKPDRHGLYLKPRQSRVARFDARRRASFGSRCLASWMVCGRMPRFDVLRLDRLLRFFGPMDQCRTVRPGANTSESEGRVGFKPTTSGLH